MSESASIDGTQSRDLCGSAPGTVSMVFKVLVLAACAAAGSVQAQSPTRRDGSWSQVGVGYGSRSCETCASRNGGMGVLVARGTTLTPALRLGLAVNAWIGPVKRRSFRGTTSGVEMLFVFAPVARYHPEATRNVSFFAGVGLGVTATTVAFWEAGSAALIGIHYEPGGSQPGAFALFAQGTVVRVGGKNVNLVQFGVAVNAY